MSAEIATKAAAYVQSANIGTDRLATADITAGVEDAIRRFSGIDPRVVNGSVEGNGTPLYDLSGVSLTGWNEDFSEVLAVAYPWEDGGLSDETLDDDAWVVFGHPTNGKTLRLDTSPAAGSFMLISFSALHADGGTGTNPTVRPDKVDAVAKLAASNICLMMAARCADGKESTIGADSFNGVSQSSQWASLALKLEKEALGQIGSGDDAAEPEAASATFAYDRDLLAGHGYGRLTKGQRY